MEPEIIVSNDDMELVIVASEPQITLTRCRLATGQQPARRHVHLQHTDSFYVLDGAIALEIGPDAERVVVDAGGSITVPPGVAHCFLNVSGADATVLNIHAPDGGFAEFMRGMRDGVAVEWDHQFVS